MVKIHKIESLLVSANTDTYFISNLVFSFPCSCKVIMVVCFNLRCNLMGLCHILYVGAPKQLARDLIYHKL